MNSKERVISALTGVIPDRVPYMYCIVEHNIREAILGEKITYPYARPRADFGPFVTDLNQPGFMEPSEAIDARVARKLGLDAIGMQFFPPFFVKTKETDDGHYHIASGLLNNLDAIRKMVLPDPDDEAIYSYAKGFVKEYKDEFALYARIRIGVSFLLNCMGLEEFSYAMFDEPETIHELLGTYSAWVKRIIRNLKEVGFDFFWAFDDLAYNSMPMFSADTFDEFFLPHLKGVADTIEKPWIFHSDGNILPILDSLKKLGMNGIHPLEPGCMDLSELKKNYGKDLTLIGNIDINYTLTSATRNEVFQTVKERIEQLGPGGRYIISDSNSIPSYCSPRNIMYMAEAVREYGHIY